MCEYKKEICPYDICMLLTAKKVLEWVIEQENRVHNNIHNQTILGLIDDDIMNEIVRQVRIKRLEDYSIEELENEIKSRKKKRNNYGRQRKIKISKRSFRIRFLR